MEILGIPIDNLSKKEVLNHIRGFLDEPRYHRTATVNPEFLLLAEQDAAFHEALLAADLRITDGFGIVLAGLLHGRCITRFPGADLMEAILEIANKHKLSIYLAVRADGLSSYEEVATAISKKYPGLNIDGANMDTESVCRIPYAGIGTDIRYTKYDILLCNFGAPEQELFLANLKNNPKNIRLGMGVGGSFDYLTGKLRRAPKCLRMFGLEWLWRLILQPKRFGRIWNAVIVFPWRCMTR